MKSHAFALVVCGLTFSSRLVFAVNLEQATDLDTISVLHEGSISKDACEKGMSGVSLLQVRIGFDGRPTQVEAIGTENESLEPTAIETGKTFSFHPSTEDGEPIEASVILILNIMNDSESAVKVERCKLEYSLASSIKEIDGFEPPELLTRFTPHYPVMAAQIGMEGRVVVGMCVDKEGTPTKLVAKKSTDKSFEEASLYAAEHLRFKPAYYKGRPINLYIRFSFRFTFKEMRGLIEHFDYGYELR